ncbi:hypothetical protein E3N88_35911 [Mikania micrantha]|uniref:Uncharacterized protein n=1 Tax=Mikania micrantha TaxID=192012 RepID=A0A5N6M2S3_9ASTR|nr:hypothetical protein E3N88_35911 [Mikania micrantha]
MEIRSGWGIFELLHLSFKTIKGNRKLLLLPVLAYIYLIEPVVKNLTSRLTERLPLFQDLGNNMHQTGSSSPVIRSVNEVLVVHTFIMNFCSITPLLFLHATASSSASSSQASTSKIIDLKEMILKMGQSSKKVALTSFYLYVFIMGPIYVWSFCMGITSNLAESTWTDMFHAVFLLLIPVYELYACAIGMMSLVVSVLDDVGGLNAVVRARKLMKGKELQASLMMMFFALALGLVHSITNGISSRDIGNGRDWIFRSI